MVPDHSTPVCLSQITLIPLDYNTLIHHCQEDTTHQRIVPTVTATPDVTTLPFIQQSLAVLPVPPVPGRLPPPTPPRQRKTQRKEAAERNKKAPLTPEGEGELRRPSREKYCVGFWRSQARGSCQRAVLGQWLRFAWLCLASVLGQESQGLLETWVPLQWALAMRGVLEWDTGTSLLSSRPWDSL